jgi:hypothetical protein
MYSKYLLKLYIINLQQVPQTFTSTFRYILQYFTQPCKFHSCRMSHSMLYIFKYCGCEIEQLFTLKNYFVAAVCDCPVLRDLINISWYERLNIIILNNNNNNNSAQFNAIGIHQHAGLTAQVTMAKTAQWHKYGTSGCCKEHNDTNTAEVAMEKPAQWHKYGTSGYSKASTMTRIQHKWLWQSQDNDKYMAQVAIAKPAQWHKYSTSGYSKARTMTQIQHKWL